MPLYGIMYTGLGGKPPFTTCILYIVTLMKVFPMRERERERGNMGRDERRGQRNEVKMVKEMERGEREDVEMRE